MFFGEIGTSSDSALFVLTFLSIATKIFQRGSESEEQMRFGPFHTGCVRRSFPCSLQHSSVRFRFACAWLLCETVRGCYVRPCVVAM